MYHVERTLFIAYDDAYIYCDNARIVVKLGEDKHYFGYDNVESIIIFTDKTTLSVYTMRNCAEHKITIHYVSKYGKYIGSFMGYETGNILLRKLQFEMIGTEKEKEYIRSLLAAKFKIPSGNSRPFNDRDESVFYFRFQYLKNKINCFTSGISNICKKKSFIVV